MANPFATNLNAMAQKMMGGMVQNAIGNLPPIMQLMANPDQVAQQYQQFRQQYQGNPEEDLNKLLQEGTLTQKQLQQLMMMSQVLPNV